MTRKYSLHYRHVFEENEEWYYELEDGEPSNQSYGSEDEAHASLQRYVEHWL